MARNAAGKTADPPSSGSRKGGKRSGKKGKSNLWIYCAGGLLVLAVAAYFGRKAVESSPAVIVLTEDSFDDFVKKNPGGALVEFFIPSCGHCQKLKPEFEAAAQEVKAKGGAPFATVNGDEIPTLSLKYEVTRYPTMLWFRKGENMLELGPTTRTKDKLVEYVEWASQPAVIDFETAAEWNEAVPTLRQTLTAEMAPLVVGFGGHDGLYAIVERSAEKLRGKVPMVFVREKHPDGVALQAVAHVESEDKQFSGAIEPDVVLNWTKTFVKKRSKTNETQDAN